MISPTELRKNTELLDRIDWSMTPEKAIDMYLEWGAGWTRGHDFVHGYEDESIYFVVYEWETPPQVTLLRRNMREVEEIAKVPVPQHLFDEACREDGRKPGVGVHRLNKNLMEWLHAEIGGPPTDFVTFH